MIVYCDWLFNIFLRGYIGITLFPFIFVHSLVGKVELEHEMVHLKQQKKFLIIGFYAVYIFWYLVNLVKFRNHWVAYYQIPFEKEAYIEAQGQRYYERALKWAMMS